MFLKNPYTFFLLVLCIASNSTAVAQSPGYMGKKTSVQLNLSSSFAWFGPTTNNNGASAFNGEPTKFGSGFNTKYGIALNRSVGRRVSFEASVDYGKTGYINEQQWFETVSVFNGAGYGSLDRHKLFFNANVTDFSLAMRMFNRRKGSISPLGLYFGPRIGYTRVRSEILDRITDYHESSEGRAINSLGLLENNSFYKVGFTTGYNRIVKDAIILNLSWDFAQYIGGDIYTDGVIEDFDETVYEYFNRKEQQRILRQRLSNLNLFLFRIGVGYLF